MLGFSYAYLNYAVLVLFTSFATGIDTAVPTTKLAIASTRPLIPTNNTTNRSTLVLQLLHKLS